MDDRLIFAAMLASCLGLCFAAASAEAQPFASEIGPFLAQDVTDPPPEGGVVFVGSSSIRRWEQLGRDFADYDIIQRGIGGSRFSDINPLIDDLVLPYNPAAIVMFVGTNDVASGQSATTVFNNYLSFVSTVRAAPGNAQTPIFYIGITPAPSRSARWPIADDVNQRIAAHAAADPTLTYIDTVTAFLDAGAPASAGNPRLFISDNLHLNQDGYDIFSDHIGSALRSAVSPTKSQGNTNPLGLDAGKKLLFDFGPSNAIDGNHTIGLDPNGSLWNNWHAVVGDRRILAGQRKNNLFDVEGNNTGIDLVITGGFKSNGRVNGGLLGPDPALLGDFAVGTVTEDYFFGDNIDSPAGLMLTGLDPEQPYDLKLFGTRQTTQTRITEYTLLGEASDTLTLQTSGLNLGDDGVYDGNDNSFVTFLGVRPDAYGQFFLDVHSLTNNFSYLGGLELTAAIPEPTTGLVMLALLGLRGRRRQGRRA